MSDTVYKKLNLYDINHNKINGKLSPVYITPKYKVKWVKNPITGEEHSQDIPLNGFLVDGGGCGTSSHTTLDGAKKEKASRESFLVKFPFTVQRTQRELDKAKRLGLNQ